MSSENNALLTVKIIVPSESRGLFQTHVCTITEMSYGVLHRKVLALLPSRMNAFNLYWWARNRYCNIADDTSFLQAIQDWCTDDTGRSTSIYVTLNNREPFKVYGRVPYDRNVNNNPDEKGHKHHRLSLGKMRHRLSLFHRPSKSRTSTTLLPGDEYAPLSSMAYAQQRESYARRDSDRCTSIRNTHLWNAPIEPAPTVPTPSTNAYQTPAVPAQTTLDPIVEDALQQAVETLQNMGFQHDERVLRQYISQTNGNLNEIIDLLQAHDFQ